MSRAHRVPLVLIVLIALIPAAFLAGPSWSAEETRTKAERRGQRLYQIYCASCHGTEGRGGGPVAEVLTVPPTDLTRLAASHDGEFPTEEARRVIDGRTDVAGHGHREMPVWGLSFQVPGRVADQESEVRGRIDDLIAYLRTIQKTPRE